MKRVSLKRALKFIKESNGQFFSIEFEKRTTGELRIMRCRTGVKKFLAENPTRPGVNFAANYSLCVYDVDKGGYRTIPVEGITRIMISSEWCRVVQTVGELDLSKLLGKVPA